MGKGKGKCLLVEKEEKKLKTICVFCVSRSGNRPSFTDAAIELGKDMVKRKIDLIYGGGTAGLMGLMSKTVNNGGCQFLETIGQKRTVSDMHERKFGMAKNVDAIIALPGGYGTMEELLEVITWSQLGIHA